MKQTISQQLADFALDLDYDDLPKDVVEAAKRFLFDSLGCAFGGYHTKDVNILRDIFGPMGRGTKSAYREALRLIREFAHSF